MSCLHLINLVPMILRHVRTQREELTWYENLLGTEHTYTHPEVKQTVFVLRFLFAYLLLICYSFCFVFWLKLFCFIGLLILQDYYKSDLKEQTCNKTSKIAIGLGL